MCGRQSEYCLVVSGTDEVEVIIQQCSLRLRLVILLV